MKIFLEKEALRLASGGVRRVMRKRPELGLFLIVAAAAFLYFRPDWPGLFPNRPDSVPPAPGESAAILNGRVVRVADGDTLTLETDGGRVRVRLFGLDAPEMDQPRGRESKKGLARLVGGQTARVEVTGRDQFGRTLGRVFVGERAVDRDMVSAGWAWVYEGYCRGEFCRELAVLQAEAKEGRRGLWRDPDPKPPWVWRKESGRR